ncbi:threonine/homoserine/homoserine lactone efflux protein [Kribbella rubisoli]|uniref:Threonine/homoserine/homoserine lactone efflux protein n=1 Tax=Kribbella rubisoli TaxID=3075929 RepID=A0A4Q7X2H1_9ACTN|nr:LysE family translocator [Kribbella rubisoli]RZU16375.1 threonine/homoserine/homoserine lactone efflux protein [Kribbella rubisoli]
MCGRWVDKRGLPVAAGSLGALLRGRRQALLSALGVLTADFVWVAGSVLGLTAVLVASQTAFTIVRYVAAHLIYLGLRLLLGRHHAGLEASDGIAQRIPRPRSSWNAFREGLLCDLSNPKTMIVFASVIPQFLGTQTDSLQALVLGVVFAVIGFASLLCYALLFGAAGNVLRNRRITTLVMRTGAAILTVFGVGLVLDRQPA